MIIIQKENKIKLSVSYGKRKRSTNSGVAGKSSVQSVLTSHDAATLKAQAIMFICPVLTGQIITLIPSIRQLLSDSYY